MAENAKLVAKIAKREASGAAHQAPETQAAGDGPADGERDASMEPDSHQDFQGQAKQLQAVVKRKEKFLQASIAE